MLKYNLLNNNVDLSYLVNDNNLDLFNILYDNDLLCNIYDKESISPYTNCLFNIACLKGQLKICRFLYEKYNIQLTSNYFILTCFNGHLNVAMWLYNYVDILKTFIYENQNVDAFYIACVNNQYNILIWLINLEEIKNYINTCRWKYLFIRCCRLGFIKIVKLLYYNNIYDKNNLDISFLLSCHNNNLELCKWLFKLNIIDIHIYNDFVFIGSCYNGCLDVCKWLYEKVFFNDEILNIAFAKSCIYNQKDICLWLLSISNINIHYEDEYAFRLSDLENQKWLMTLDSNIDVNAKNESAFYYACYNNNIEQVEWLLNFDIDIYNVLKKNFYYNIYNNDKFIKLLINNGIDIYYVNNEKLKNKLKNELFVFVKLYFYKYICDDLLLYMFDFI